MIYHAEYVKVENQSCFFNILDGPHEGEVWCVEVFWPSVTLIEDLQRDVLHVRDLPTKAKGVPPSLVVVRGPLHGRVLNREGCLG